MFSACGSNCNEQLRMNFWAEMTARNPSRRSDALSRDYLISCSVKSGLRCNFSDFFDHLFYKVLPVFGEDRPHWLYWLWCCCPVQYFFPNRTRAEAHCGCRRSQTTDSGGCSHLHLQINKKSNPEARLGRRSPIAADRFQRDFCHDLYFPQ